MLCHVCALCNPLVFPLLLTAALLSNKWKRYVQANFLHKMCTWYLYVSATTVYVPSFSPFLVKMKERGLKTNKWLSVRTLILSDWDYDGIFDVHLNLSVQWAIRNLKQALLCSERKLVHFPLSFICLHPSDVRLPSSLALWTRILTTKRGLCRFALCSVVCLYSVRAPVGAHCWPVILTG